MCKLMRLNGFCCWLVGWLVCIISVYNNNMVSVSKCKIRNAKRIFSFMLVHASIQWLNYKKHFKCSPLVLLYFSGGRSTRILYLSKITTVSTITSKSPTFKILLK